MAKKLDLKTVVMGDLRKSGYRLGQSKALEVAKQLLIAGLEKDETIKEHTKEFAKFLDTPIGKAMLSYFVGIGLTYAPKINNNEHVFNLAREFRVDGMHKVGHEFVDQIKENIVPVINQLRSSTKPKIRVVENKEVEEVDNFNLPVSQPQKKQK